MLIGTLQTYAVPMKIPSLLFTEFNGHPALDRRFKNR